MGARHRSSLARPAERGPAGRGALSRGDRPARPLPHRTRTRPRAPALRRMASPRRQARRCPRATTCGTRNAHWLRHGRIRRARSPRTHRHRRKGTQTPTENRGDLTAQEARSPNSRARAIPTRRSAPSCSSAHARSSGTCARSSPSSGSAPAESSRCPWLLANRGVRLTSFGLGRRVFSALTVSSTRT